MSDLGDAYQVIMAAMRVRYPDAPDDEPEATFTSGIGDGYLLSIEAILRSAFGRDWRN